MNKYFALLFRKPKKNDILTQMRRRILKPMLTGSFWIGTVLYAIALIPVIHKDLHATILVYSILYAWIILITFLPHLPYRARAIGWLGLFFVLGIINLFMSGFNVDAGLFFITFIAMAILLMDLPGGVVALVLGSIAISISGFVNVRQYIHLSMGLPQSDPLLWIIGGVVFLLMGSLVNYSLTKVMYGLDDNLAKATFLSEELEQTNKSLRMSEARYRTLVETSPSLVTLFDLNGTIVMTNQVGLALFGYDNPDEVAGKDLLIFIAPEDQPRVAEAFQRVLRSGEIKDFEFIGLRKDGTFFNAEFSATSIKDKAGTPEAVIAVGRDITERKEAQKILREAKEALAQRVVETSVQLKQTSGRLDELVKHGPAVIFSYRASDHAFTYMSENVATFLGYEAHCFTDDPNFWRSLVHPEDARNVISQMDLDTKQERTKYDYRLLKKDGTYCWLHSERVLLYDPQGNPMDYVGSWSDITERKKNEESLRFFQDRYRTLYESMMDAYTSVDMDGRIKQFNWAYLHMLGYATEELQKLTYQDLTPKKWHEIEAEIIAQQVIPRGYSDIYEKEYIRKDGTVLPVELRTVLMRDGVGIPSGMWAIVRDISERKRSEKALQESEQRYRELLDSSLQGVVVFQDMRIVYVNQTLLDALGFTENELKSLRWVEILKRIHPDDRRKFLERMRTTLKGAPIQERNVLRVIRKDGETLWAEVKTSPILLQGKPASITTGIDVTEIRRAEAEIQENAKILQTILNASEALVCLVDPLGKLIASNEKFAKRMGLQAGTVPGTSMYDLLPEDVLRRRKVPFDKVLSSGKSITFIDNRDDTWFENSLYPILDGSGKVMSVAVYARDITEQRRLTEALRTSEEQYRSLAETSHDVIFIINRDDKINYVNSFGAKTLGKEPHELVGQPRERFFPPDTSQHQRRTIQKVIATGEAISSENANELPTGTVWLHTWLVPLRDASGEVVSVLGVSRDITNRRRAEEALLQAQVKLEERVAERTKELFASQEQLRLLTAQTIHAQETERRSISRELHDEAGQALITLKFSLATIQNDLSEKETVSRKRLSDSMTLIDQTMTNIRNLAHSLRPPVMEIGGIHLSLQDYCQEISKRAQIPISYQGVDIPGLPYDIGISLFRFVQEGLTNIMKHSQATKVKVRLQYKKGEISLSVSDNGSGINEAAHPDGIGLLGIKERLSLLGGKLEIHSQPKQGVQLVGLVPWVKPGKT